MNVDDDCRSPEGIFFKVGAVEAVGDRGNRCPKGESLPVEDTGSTTLETEGSPCFEHCIESLVGLPISEAIEEDLLTPDGGPPFSAVC